MPSMRVTGMSADAGLMPSSTLNDAATALSRTPPSWVPGTAPISVRPIWPPPSIRPGVIHLPVASILVAPLGTATFVPTAAIRPSRIRTVPFSILGPDTG